ncbi:MAG TPA: methyltransferase domain-containing protein [Kofleriaceae bacterium]|nr:methyltransferase domain-containing protein [Kofleriaceae bacterium]
MVGYDDIAELYDFSVEHAIGGTNFSVVVAPRVRAFLESRIASRPPALLDIGCGSGQLAVEFANRGWTVLALDHSAPMLLAAARNVARGDVEGRVELRRADATGFTVGRRFDAATAIFNVVNHLRDEAALAAAFGCVRRALVDGGWFVFDLNMRVLLETWGDCDSFSFAGPAGAELFVVRRRSYDPAAAIARRELVCFEQVGEGHYRKRVGATYNRAYPASRIAALLSAAGFADIAFHGDDLGERIAAPEERPVVFVVARASAGLPGESGVQ